MDTSKTVTRSAVRFLSGTLLSRLSGLGRDMTMAFYFGSHPAIAAFMVAFRFANLFRRLVGEGPLASGFIPYFENVRKESEEKAAHFFRDTLFSLFFFLIFVISVVEMVLLVCGKGEILFLTALMLPGLLFISLFGIGSGFLQCEKKFFLSGFAPTCFNLVWILSLVLIRHQTPIDAMRLLSIGVVIGFVAQAAILGPEIFKFFKRFFHSFSSFCASKLFSSEVKAMLKPLCLSMIGVGAVQMNTALDAIFARIASLEGPAYLWYAMRIQQLPLALFGIALSSALLPPLSRMIRDGQKESYLDLLRFALERSFALIFPCTLGIFVLGSFGINLLYGHGDFSNTATLETYFCLCGYGLGLLPAVFILILAPSFYAQRDYRTPMIGSLIAVVLNAFLSLFFVMVLKGGAESIAYATSLSAFVNYGFLSKKLSQKMGVIRDKTMTQDFVRSALATGIAAGVTLAGSLFLPDANAWQLWKRGSEELFSRDLGSQALHCLALSGLFLVTLMGAAFLLKARSLLQLVGMNHSSLVMQDEIQNRDHRP